MMLLRVACLLFALVFISVQGDTTDPGIELIAQLQNLLRSAIEIRKANDKLDELDQEINKVNWGSQLVAVSKLATYEHYKILQDIQHYINELEGLKFDFDNVEKDQNALEKTKNSILSIDTDKYDVSDLYNGHIYLLSKENEDFDLGKMNDLCKSQGGYLVELNDQDEQAFVAEFTDGFGYNLYYTGMNSVASPGHFVYYNSGEPMANLKWQPGEPNNYGGNERCVNIRLNGINDARCVRSCRHVCELPLF